MSVIYDWVADDQIKYFMDFVPEQLRLAYEKEQQLMIYGIVEDHAAVGAAVVHVMEPESVLRYIYVAPDYRGRGLCGECIAHLSYSLWKTGAHWLSARYIPKEHETLHRWLTFHGAITSPSGCGSFCFTLKDVKDNKNFSGSTAGVLPLGGCAPSELALLGSQIKKQGFCPLTLPIAPADYDADCSCVYKKDGKPQALLLVKQEKDAVELPFLYSEAESPAVLLMLMRHALQEGMKRFPEETAVTLRSVDVPMTKLIEKLLERPMEEEAVKVTLPFTAYDEYHRQFVELFLGEPMDLSDLVEQTPEDAASQYVFSPL